MTCSKLSVQGLLCTWVACSLRMCAGCSFHRTVWHLYQPVLALQVNIACSQDLFSVWRLQTRTVDVERERERERGGHPYDQRKKGMKGAVGRERDMLRGPSPQTSPQVRPSRVCPSCSTSSMVMTSVLSSSTSHQIACGDVFLLMPACQYAASSCCGGGNQTHVGAH